jgi:hydroxyacylglutathione hydrolase
VGEPREVAAGVFVATAEPYTTTTTVIAGAGGGCLVVDPAVTVADVDALAAWLSARGLHISVGWSTHPHWDHVLWSRSLGDAVRYATPRAADVAVRERTALLSGMRESAPGHDESVFARLAPWAAAELAWDGPRALVVAHDAHAPGHGALFLPQAGVLVAGDMCSDIEIPLLDADARDPFGTYRHGLGRLASLPGVRVVVPGHGHTGDAAEFRRRVAADFAYLDAVEAGRDCGDSRLGVDWLRTEHERHIALLGAGPHPPHRDQGWLGPLTTRATHDRASGALLQHEHRDQARCPLLILGVRRVGRDGPLPPRGALVAGQFARRHLPLVGPVLHFHARVGAQVVVPERVLGRPALGRDCGVAAVVLDPHHRRLANSAGLRAAVGDDHHGQPGVAQRRPGAAARTLVLLDLVPDPRGRAWYILTVYSHGPIQHQPAPAGRGG